jgi:E1A/CREB-binding protein
VKATTERKFEGIKLEGAGANVPTAPVTSLSICEVCYLEEKVRQHAGLKLRLPGSVTPQDLTQETLPAQNPDKVKDPDPDIENEFFETRQVGSRSRYQSL